MNKKRNFLRVGPSMFENAAKTGTMEYGAYTFDRSWEVGDQLTIRLRRSELSMEAVCLDAYVDRDGFDVMVFGMISCPIKKL